jgi:hypothetical protein
LRQFIENKPRSVAEGRIGEAIAVFEDRSSLRVTDVSSVVYRDFALFHIYSLIEPRAELPAKIPKAVIDEVRGVASKEGDAPFELILDNVVSIEEWSATL